MCLFHLRFSRDKTKFKKYTNDRKIIEFDRKLPTCPVNDKIKNEIILRFLFSTLLKLHREMDCDILKKKRVTYRIRKIT